MVTTCSKFCVHTEEYLEQVSAGKSPLLVKRKKGQHVVVLPESEYNSIMETLHLLGTSANATRLYRAIGDSKRWKAEQH